MRSELRKMPPSKIPVESSLPMTWLPWYQTVDRPVCVDTQSDMDWAGPIPGAVSEFPPLVDTKHGTGKGQHSGQHTVYSGVDGAIAKSGRASSPAL